MAGWIRVRGADYFPAAWLLSDGPEADEAALVVQSRQSFVSSKQLRLDRTSGAYVRVGERDLLLAIDRRTVEPGSEEWRFIGRVTERLAACWDGLSAQARAALESLAGVVFSTSPQRAFADVKPNTFVYDVDEFRRPDGSFVSPSYAASNIVHDANHIWMFDNHQTHTGEAAEVVCWQLQVDNAGPLGLEPYEVDFLQNLIGNPTLVAARIEQDPLQKLACSQLGKCAVGTA